MTSSRLSEANLVDKMSEVLKNQLICRVYDSGYEDGEKEGERVGRSTLSVMWFFYVAMFMFAFGGFAGFSAAIFFNYVDAVSKV